MIRYLTIMFWLACISNYASNPAGGSTEEVIDTPALCITNYPRGAIDPSVLTIFTTPKGNCRDGITNVLELYTSGLLDLKEDELCTVFMKNGTEQQIGTLIGTSEPAKWGIILENANDVGEKFEEAIGYAESDKKIAYEFCCIDSFRSYLEERNASLIWKGEKHSLDFLDELFRIEGYPRNCYRDSPITVKLLQNDSGLQVEFPDEQEPVSVFCLTSQATSGAWSYDFDFTLIPHPFHFGIIKFTYQQYCYLIRFLNLCEEFCISKED